MAKPACLKGDVVLCGFALAAGLQHRNPPCVQQYDPAHAASHARAPHCTLVRSNLRVVAPRRAAMHPDPGRVKSRTDETYGLSHMKWDCKYHVVFIPKCRRKAMYGR